LQGASQAASNSAEYVIYHSGFEMIVHRLVKYPEPKNFQYYIEASPAIPVDSQEYPHLAVVAAILFDAGAHPFTPLAEPPPPSPSPRTPSLERISSVPPKRPKTEEQLKVFLTLLACYFEAISYTSERSNGPNVFGLGSRTVSFYYNSQDFFFLIFNVEAMVHFDCEGRNDRDIWAVDVIATPSSSHRSIPKLDDDYWDRMRAVPRIKLARLGVKPNSIREGPDLPNPELLVSSQSTIKISAEVATGATCTAFRGTWFGVPIVVKRCYTMDYVCPLAEEVHAYLRLGHLCGSVVPEFFGLYRSDFFALVVLEDAGDKIKEPLIPRTCLDEDYLDTVDCWPDLDVQERCAFNFHAITCLLTWLWNDQAGLVLCHVPCPHVWR
jgi:hypothetical protein